MMDRIRSRLRPGAGQPAIARQRRTSRRERELQQRRLLYLGAGVVGVLAVLILLGGAAYQYYFLPRQDLARVDGTAIERRDYWKVRDLQLRQQVAQLSQQYQLVPADQQPEILQRIEDATLELEDVQGAPVSSDTLSAMVDDLVIVKNMESMGVSINDADMEAFILDQFAPVPLTEPTQTPTTEPTAAAWATGTAETNAANATATSESAAATASAQATTTESATGTADAATTGTPEAAATESTTATAGAETTGTPAAEGTADGTVSPTVPPTATATITPSSDEARATSESTFRQFETNYLDPADMSRDDYKRLIVKPALARLKIGEQLANAVPTRAEQVHALHILVATRDAADAVVARINEGEDFGDIAREVSTDTSTAGTGGDLGWFPRGVMVDSFEEAAFNLGVDEVSEPVQSEFGWHIIKVLEAEADRPLTLSTRQQMQNSAFGDWLIERRGQADIWSDIPLPELDVTSNQTGVFEAPPEAPPLPTATPLPTEPIPTEGTSTSDAGETPGATTTP